MASVLQLIKALSEPVRIRLYLLLSQSALTVSEISEILRISQSNASHHVKALRELGLLLSEKNGQHTYYSRDIENTSSSRLTLLFATLEDAALDLPERASDGARLKQILAEREGDTFSRWRMVQPDLPYSDIFAHLVCGKRGSVLDIGCGEGDFFEALHLSFDFVCAVDRDFSHTQKAYRRKTKTAIFCTDAMGLPFRDETFDAVVLRMALSQMDAPELVLAEATRVLRPSGYLSIIDTNAENKLKQLVAAFCIKHKAIEVDFEKRLPQLFMLRLRLVAGRPGFPQQNEPIDQK